MKNLVTLRFMLVSLFAIMSMAVSAEVIEYSTDDGFKYYLDTEAKTAELERYYGSATEVSISESVTYNDVVYSVTSLGEDCFRGCFSLTSISIPSFVTSLGGGCFQYCSSLTSIVVDAGNSVYDSRENCNAVIETESNTMICGCAGTVIPSSVTSLGNGCFEGCSSLTSINIPSSVTSLGENCFSACRSLTSIVVDAENSVYDSRENCNAIIETESNTMICGCARTVIPSSVTSLGGGCFQYCISLKSINIPSSVTSLGDNCFWGCHSLTSINIPSSVTSLGNYCFQGCSSLTSINIPSSVTSLGNYCFYYCSSLTSIDIPSSVTSLGNGCFADCYSLTSINIPSSVTSLGEKCFYKCSSLTSINIPSSVTSLEENCFYNCSSLTSINIPSSVTSLGYNCFYDCSSLTSINIPSSVTSLGGFCFYGCSSLTSINIPSSVTSLGGYCFYNCSSLKTVTCEVPAPIGDNYIFSKTPINEATLYVPEVSLNSYMATLPWSDFGTILAIKSSGIESNTVGTSATVDAIYNLEGKRCDGMKSGMNILRMSDGTTRKIMK